MPGPPDRRDALAAGLLLGWAADAVIADPRRGHPVALFGSAASSLERRVWADDVRRGAAYWVSCVLPVVTLGVPAGRARGALGVAVTAAATWSVLGGRSLRVEAATIAGQLAAGDLPAARVQLTHLVGRDPSRLDEAEIVRAALESVAENTCDAVVAPLLWGAAFGVPGLVGYRAVNTLDAMVGHRSPRHEKFGRVSARADDIANLVPARVTALLVAAVAPLAGGRGTAALRVARRDGRRHPSPNSGVSEAAFAGALGVRLGGRNDYGGRVEDRPTLGDGRAPDRDDLARAARLCGLVGAAAGVGAAALAASRRRRSDRQRSSRSPSVSR